MPSPRFCEYVVLQLAPDPIRNEAVNIGIALRETEGDFVAVHVTPDFGRVHCLFPAFETAHLTGLKESLEAALRRDPGAWVHQAEETFSQSLRVGSFHGLATPDPANAARELYRRLVRPAVETEARPAAARGVGPRRRILARMRDWFEESNLLPQLRLACSAADLGIWRDPFRFDFYYRKRVPDGGHPHVFLQAVDLGGSAARIKELCFTVQSLRSHVREGVEARAVHEPDFAEHLHGAYLREAGIQLIPLVEGARLVGRVGADLGRGQ